MLQTKIEILSTKKLNAALVNEAAANNIFIDEIPFIEIKDIVDRAVKQKIISLSKQNAAIVFTSANAVEAVAKFISKNISWKIYCIEGNTKNEVEKYFPTAIIASAASNATDLANKIIANNEKEIIFFCGNKRLNELPGKLKQHNIAVDEIIVYETILTPTVINKNYSGILFFSPSAVESFFSVNKINDETVLFSIGKTTADEVKKYCNNKIVISKKASKKMLVEETINYFKSEKIKC